MNDFCKDFEDMIECGIINEDKIYDFIFKHYHISSWYSLSEGGMDNMYRNIENDYYNSLYEVEV